jgi:hypothetical protein
MLTVYKFVHDACQPENGQVPGSGEMVNET